jgi:hypothetical protein
LRVQSSCVRRCKSRVRQQCSSLNATRCERRYGFKKYAEMRNVGVNDHTPGAARNWRQGAGARKKLGRERSERRAPERFSRGPLFALLWFRFLVYSIEERLYYGRTALQVPGQGRPLLKRPERGVGPPLAAETPRPGGVVSAEGRCIELYSVYAV